MENNSHDNVTNVRLNTRVNFYGPVIFISAIPIVGVALVFLGIWMATHWSAAVALSGWLVYGFFSLVTLTLLILIAALAVKIVIHPLAAAQERHVQARGQSLRNRIAYAQENVVVVEMAPGKLQVVPLLPAPVIDAVEAELEFTEDTVKELYKEGMSNRDIAKKLNTTYYQIQKITGGTA